MSRLRTFAQKNETQRTFRVICLDEIDIRAARMCNLSISEEFLQGRNTQVAFASFDQAEARRVQIWVSNTANSLRFPPGTNSAAEGKKIKAQKAENHLKHQEARRKYLRQRRERKESRRY